MTDVTELVMEARILGGREWQSWWPGRAQRSLSALADALEELDRENTALKQVLEARIT